MHCNTLRFYFVFFKNFILKCDYLKLLDRNFTLVRVTSYVYVYTVSVSIINCIATDIILLRNYHFNYKTQEILPHNWFLIVPFVYCGQFLLHICKLFCNKNRVSSYARIPSHF